jgi:diaminopimelate decarboxylase
MLNPNLWPDTTSIDDGQLIIGGCDTGALAHEFGTPLYILDETTLRGTMRAYREAFGRAYPHLSAVHYASKALINTALTQIVDQERLGLDVVSSGELFVARRAGLPMERVHLHGNAKNPAELERALDWGVGAIVVDTLDELALLAHLSAGRSQQQAILIRLAPGIDAHTHAHIATGGVDSKFGLPLGALGRAAELVKSAPSLRLVGLHAHIGSQIFDFEALQLNVEVLLDCAALLRDQYGLLVEEISPGGGLGVPYTDEDRPTDIAAYAQALSQVMLEGLARHRLPPLRLTVEPGRSIVARAGVALYRIIAMKRPDATSQTMRPYLHIDGGMADNLRPALYGARYTALLANRADATSGTPVHIAGRFCESGDVLIRNVALPPAGPGDLVAVAVAGAYTLSMASNYNLAPRPALVLVGEGRARLIQRRETEEDLIARDVML